MAVSRLAHISDPHFASATYDPRQFLSKRWIGNLNLLLFRRREYQTEHLWHLPDLLDSLLIEHVCITGDFTTTTREVELEEGARFVKAFSQPTHVLPGNHDCYTRKAQRKQLFYNYFDCKQLKENRIEKTALGKGWWYVGLDCAIATPPLQAKGLFSKKMEATLRETLSSIPPSDQVVIANHFPLFGGGRPAHDLTRAHNLQLLLKEFPAVRVYLHGHDHSPYIIDRTQDGFPLVLNSGSVAHRPDGTFNVIELSKDACLVERCRFRKEKGEFSWVFDLQKRFVFPQ